MASRPACSPGSVNNFAVRSVRIDGLLRVKPDQVALRVQAAGLNFRDVLNILNLDPTRTVQRLGLECASIVDAADERVEHVLVGESVYGLAMGCLASTVHVDGRW